MKIVLFTHDREKFGIIFLMTKVAHEFISEQLQGLTCDLTWKNNNEGTSDLGMDRDERYRITLKLEGKADRTAGVSTDVTSIVALLARYHTGPPDDCFL